MSEMYDVLLIQSRNPKAGRLISSFSGMLPPMMLGYLAAPLVRKGYKVGILDLTVSKMDREEFCRYISSVRPSIVGLTCTTPCCSNAGRIAGLVKQIDPGTRVILGGPHATFTAKETLENPNIDVVVRGEGDFNFPLLVDYFLNRHGSLSDIKGISYRENNEILETPIEMIPVLDVLPFPARELMDFSPYRIKGVLHATRGCPFNCTFCAATAMYGGKYRTRSMENINEEIDYMVKHLGFDSLFFTDDTLTIFPQLLEGICNHIINNRYTFSHVTMHSRADIKDLALLKLMARAGCKRLLFGFESGSEAVLKSMAKHIKPQDIEHAVRLCLKAGIHPYGSFIIGFPHDTLETIEETAALAERIQRIGGEVGLGVVTPLPGTYIRTHSEELGITIHSSDWDDYSMDTALISTGYLAKEQIRAAFFDLKRRLSWNADFAADLHNRKN
jgi:anaerobic magnesium-protoporphyrin IX monomethyl ester cyclase